MTMITVSSKGQVVLPASIRRRFGLTAGTQLEIIEESNGLRLLPSHSIAFATIAACAGLVKAPPSLKGKPRSLADFDAAALLLRLPK